MILNLNLFPKIHGSFQFHEATSYINKEVLISAAVILFFLILILFLFVPRNKIEILTIIEINKHLSEEERIQECLPYVFMEWNKSGNIGNIINKVINIKLKAQYYDFDEFKKLIKNKKEIYFNLLSEIPEEILIFYCQNLYLEKTKLKKQ